MKINYYYVFTIKCEFFLKLNLFFYHFSYVLSENFIVKNLQTHSIFKLFFRYRITLDITVLNLGIDQNLTIFDIFWAKKKIQLYIFACLNFTFLIRISLKKDCKLKLKIDF